MTLDGTPMTLPGGSAPLLTAFTSGSLLRNGVPDVVTAAGRERCHRLLVDVLDPYLRSLRHSPLGAAWTDVFDAYLHRAIPTEQLAQLGWLPLHRLAPRHRQRGSRTPELWAVVMSGEVLAAVRLHVGPVPHDAVATVLSRCRERREVRLRELFELRELRRLDSAFPPSSDAVRLAADIESDLDGRVLAPWASGRRAQAPAPLRGRASRRLVVALSGVDGSGKTTLRTALVASLERCGVPVSTVWVRPGMGIGWLTTLGGRVKRILGQDTAPGIRHVAAQQGAALRSRRGTVGWLWVMLIVASFVRGVWRQHRAATGVVIYDRHVIDALATLDFAYAGVSLQIPHRLVRTLLPRADVTVYLDVPTEVSVARKPDDLLGETAVRRQLAAYEHWLAVIAPTARLDGTRSPAELLAQTLDIVVRGRR